MVGTMTAPSITLIPPMTSVRTALGDDWSEERRRERRARVSRDMRRAFAEYHRPQHDRERPDRRSRTTRDGRALS
jgi:hypothetical protein